MGKEYESAELILKLYELRREETMRQARNWIAGFNPESAQDIVNAMMGERSAFYRMTTSYWEMAASLVNHGAIDEKMFNDTNAEHIFLFAKIQPFLAELRARFHAPHMLGQLEQLVMRLPDAEQTLAAWRERSKQFAAARAAAARQTAEPESSRPKA